MKKQSAIKRMYLQGFEDAAGRSPRRDEERSTSDIRQAIAVDLVTAEDIGYRDGQTASEMDSQ